MKIQLETTQTTLQTHMLTVVDQAVLILMTVAQSLVQLRSLMVVVMKLVLEMQLKVVLEVVLEVEVIPIAKACLVVVRKPLTVTMVMETGTTVFLGYWLGKAKSG